MGFPNTATNDYSSLVYTMLPWLQFLYILTLYYTEKLIYLTLIAGQREERWAPSSCYDMNLGTRLVSQFYLFSIFLHFRQLRLCHFIVFVGKLQSSNSKRWGCHWRVNMYIVIVLQREKGNSSPSLRWQDSRYLSVLSLKASVQRKLRWV